MGVERGGAGRSGNLSAPIAALIVAILSLSVALFASDPALRWYMRREARSLIGRGHETGFGDDGLHETSPTGTGVILWSAITDIRENDQVVLFMRDRLPVVYVPVSAFETPAQRAEVVGYARERIGAARSTNRDEG